MSFLDTPVAFKGGRPFKCSESELDAALELRRQGYTYPWIIEVLSLRISPSTLCRLLKWRDHG